MSEFELNEDRDEFQVLEDFVYSGVTDTNKGKKRPLILEEEESEEKEDEVEEEEKEKDVEEVPIPIQNKRRGRPPGSKNKKKH